MQRVKASSGGQKYHWDSKKTRMNNLAHPSGEPAARGLRILESNTRKEEILISREVKLIVVSLLFFITYSVPMFLIC